SVLSMCRMHIMILNTQCDKLQLHCSPALCRLFAFLYVCRRSEVMLVHSMNGAPLLPQHGSPLRLRVPGWLGMTNVKWLDNIELSREVFNGHQMIAYSRPKDAQDEPRIPLTD